MSSRSVEVDRTSGSSIGISEWGKCSGNTNYSGVGQHPGPGATAGQIIKIIGRDSLCSGAAEGYGIDIRRCIKIASSYSESSAKI